MMTFAVSKFLLGPSLGLIHLLKYLLLMVSLVYLPFIFMLIGGTTLSLFFNFLDKNKPNARFRRFSKELIQKSVLHPLVGVVLGIVPMVTSILIFYQYLYGTPLTDFSKVVGEIPFGMWKIDTLTAPYHWWLSVLPVGIGLIFLYVYQYTFKQREEKFWIHFGSGLLGLILVVKGTFVFIAHKCFLLYPTMWSMVDNPLQMIFGSNILSSFGYFMHMAFIFTGATILFSYCWTRFINSNVTAFIAFGFSCISLPLFFKVFAKTEDIISGRTTLIYLTAFSVSFLVIVFLGYFFFDHKDSSKKTIEDLEEEELLYFQLVKRTGLIVTLLASLGLPIPLYIDLFVLPEAALATSVNVSYFITIFLTMILAILAGLSLFDLKKPWEKWMIPFAILGVFLFLFNDQLTRSTALKEQLLFLKHHAKQNHKEVIPAPLLKSILHGEKSNGIMTKLSISGQEGFGVFQKNCLMCHALNDTQKAGPSFGDLWGKKEVVVTKGKKRTVLVNEKYFRTSLLKPKADIVYGYAPAMTQQNLSDKEFKTMVQFLKDLRKLSKNELNELQSQAEGK